MPTVASGAIIAVSWAGKQNGQTVQTGNHYLVTITSGPDVEVASLMRDLDSFLQGFGEADDTLADCYTPDVTQIQRRQQVIYPLRYVPFVYESHAPTGTNVLATYTLPQNVSAALTVRSFTAGRHNRGTKHIGGVGDNFTLNGYVTVDGGVKYNLWGVELESQIVLTVDASNITLDPVIYNRAAPADSAGIFNHSLQNTIRVERRRTVGLGA